MTTDEWVDWSVGNAATRVPAASPCVDCTSEFAAAMRAVDRCNGEPATAHRPLAEPADPRRQRRREQWRQAGIRSRERAKAA